MSEAIAVSGEPAVVAHTDVPQDARSEVTSESAFLVHLDSFDGPFDLLLRLISKHELDVTAVSLSKVTDDFLAHLRAIGPDWEIGQVSEFLVVAATLLDLKAARLLPTGAVEDEEDLGLLEARDLLVARLLQYRAVKQVAEQLAARWAEAGRAFPRSVPLDPEFAKVLPELVLTLSPAKIAGLAAKALAPRPEPATVSLDHLHIPLVSVPEQAALITERLQNSRVLSFRALIHDADGTVVVVARFLALLELYRNGVLNFDQLEPLGELHVRWMDAPVPAGSEQTDTTTDGEGVR